MRGTGDRNRAQSELLGLALLVGIVITVSIMIVIAGGAALSDTRTHTSVHSATVSMQELDSDIQDLSAGPDQSAIATIKGMRPEGDVQIIEDSAALTVTFIDSSDGSTISPPSQDLGTIVYERDGHRVAYQAGGVFRKQANSDESSMVSPPNFDYRYQGGAPTLTLPLIKVQGSVTGDEVNLHRERISISSLSGIPPRLEESDTLEISIESEYYRAWADFLRETVGESSVSVDPANQKVTLFFEGPTVSVTGNEGVNAFSSGSVTTWSNDATIDSYDSDNGDYSSQPPSSNARFQVDGPLDLENDAELSGSVLNTEHFYLTNDPVIHGDVITGPAGSPDRFDGDNAVIEGSFSTENSLFIDPSSNARIEGDVVVGGSIDSFSPEYVGGDIHVNGAEADFDGAGSSSDTRIDGDVIVDGNFVTDDGDPIEFTGTDNQIIAYGDVTIAENVIEGTNKRVDIYAQGDVEIKSGNHIQGDVYARGDIDNDGFIPPSNDVEEYHAGHMAPRTTPVSPTPAEFELPEAANSQIEQVERQLDDGHNHNSEAGSAITELENGNCNSCELESGNYYLEQLVLDFDSPELTLDTADGDINIYVENYVEIDSQMNIEGQNNVDIYVGEGGTPLADLRVESDGSGTTVGKVSIPDDDAKQLTVFLPHEGRVKMGGASGVTPVFTGVVYGPPPRSGPADGAKIRIDSNAEIYGGMVGSLEQFSNDAEIHFDESLSSGGGTGGGATGPGGVNPATVEYFRINSQKVVVDG